MFSISGGELVVAREGKADTSRRKSSLRLLLPSLLKTSLMRLQNASRARV